MKAKNPFGMFNFDTTGSGAGFNYTAWRNAVKLTQQDFSEVYGHTQVLTPYGHEAISYLDPKRHPPKNCFRNYIYIKCSRQMIKLPPDKKKDSQQIFIKLLKKNLTNSYPIFQEKLPLILTRDETSNPIVSGFYGNADPISLKKNPNYITLYFKSIPSHTDLVTHYNTYLISTLEAIANNLLPEILALSRGSKLARNRVFQLFVLHNFVINHLIKLPKFTCQEETIFLKIFTKLRDKSALEELIPNHTPPAWTPSAEDQRILDLISNRTKLILTYIEKEPGLPFRFQAQAYHDSNRILTSTINKSFFERWLQILNDSYHSFVAIEPEAQHNDLPKPR